MRLPAGFKISAGGSYKILRPEGLLFRLLYIEMARRRSALSALLGFQPKKNAANTASSSQLLCVCSALHQGALDGQPIRLKFDDPQVWAVDANAEQLKECQPHPRIHFCTGLAESTGIPSGSIDLVTVATALHWRAQMRCYPCLFLDSGQQCAGSKCVIACTARTMIVLCVDTLVCQWCVLSLSASRGKVGT